MLNRPILKLSLTALVGMALSLMAYSDDIKDWPVRDGINLEPAKQRFIEVFSSEPENLDHLTPGFEDCLLDADKAGKLSGVNEDTILGPYESNDQVEVELDLEITEIKVTSSKVGCTALRKEVLERVPDAKFKQYQVSSAFKHGYLIYADYETDLEMTIEMAGADDHVSVTNSKMVSYMFLSQPKKTIDKAYPKEMYSFLSFTVGDIKSKNYSFYMSPLKAPNEGIMNISLNRSNSAGKQKNVVHVSEKQNGLHGFEMRGNHTLMVMLDGKRHGLNVSENYFYASDKTQGPYTHSCYDMGEKFNVFKKAADNTCTQVSDEQIGMTDVYVDQHYQMQLDSKKRIADMKRASAERIQARASASENREKTEYRPSFQEQQRLKEEAATKEKAQAFAKKQKQAKCKLNNDNWVYLGTNCKNGLANGTGSAVDRQGLRFEGDFKAGYRSKGDIHQDGQMIFSGDLKSGKPDGGAICLFEGEYEECRFFRGKRIDTLYKIRKENAKNIAKMEELQKENAMAASHGGSNNDGGSTAIVDALEKEATKRAASFIFDQLF